ncbi:MAG: ABC transporter permease [Pseudobdellovibrionaceae bacterium]
MAAKKTDWKLELSYIGKLLAINMKSAASLRAAYAIRSAFTLINHAIYLCLWVIIFHAVPSIGGWQIQHILLAYGLGILIWGILSFFAYGLRTLPKQIDHGALDVYLTQPRPVLVNVALGNTQTAGLPEILLGLIVLLIAGHITSVSIPMLLFLGLCSAIVFCSAVLAYGSLGFWLKNYHSSAEELYFNIFIMATRPEGVFHNWMAILIFTVMPVAFMTHVPLRVLLEHDMIALAITLAGTLTCSILSYKIFLTGLRHYESGSRFGVHG